MFFFLQTFLGGCDTVCHVRFWGFFFVEVAIFLPFWGRKDKLEFLGMKKCLPEPRTNFSLPHPPVEKSLRRIFFPRREDFWDGRLPAFSSPFIR